MWAARFWAPRYWARRFWAKVGAASTPVTAVGPGSLMPSPVFTGFDDEGVPLAGGLLYVYHAGTTTPADVYTDVNLTVAHNAPIVLDNAGRAIVFLPAGSFKFFLRTPDDADVWMVDPVQAVHTNQLVAGDVAVFGGDPHTPILDTSYPSGATFDKCHAGTSIHSLDSGTLPAGEYVFEGMLIVAGGTVTAGLVNLTDGAPDTPIAEISSASATGVRARSSAITFPAGGAAKDLGVKTKVSTGGGFAWGLRLLRIG